MTDRDQPIVSDHAVLRWIERRYGFDVEAERRKIEELTASGRAIGAVTVKADGGLKFILRQGYVITVLAPAMKPNRANMARSASA